MVEFNSPLRGVNRGAGEEGVGVREFGIDELVLCGGEAKKRKL